jgi:hypothetical protein
LPRAHDKYFSARLRAHRLLKSVDPACAPKAFLFQRVLPSLSDHGATAALNLNDYAFTPGYWVQVQSIVDAYHHEARDAALRFAKACSTVLEEAIWGWLGTVRRPINAPVWAPIAPDVWSVVPPSRIFADCQIDPACLTLKACAGPQPEWVFVAQHDTATTLRNTFASRCSTTTRTGSAGNWVRLGPGFTASIRRLATEGHL